MEVNKTIAIFESKQIRRHFDAETEVWYFSVIDIIEALTESINPRDYWFKMKLRLCNGIRCAELTQVFCSFSRHKLQLIACDS